VTGILDVLALGGLLGRQRRIDKTERLYRRALDRLYAERRALDAEILSMEQAIAALAAQRFHAERGTRWVAPRG